MMQRAGAMADAAVLRPLQPENRETLARHRRRDRIAIPICGVAQPDPDPALAVVEMSLRSRDRAAHAPRLLRLAPRSANRAARAPRIGAPEAPVREPIPEARPVLKPRGAGRPLHRGQVHPGATPGAAIVAHRTGPGRRLGVAGLKRDREARDPIGGAVRLGGRLPATVRRMPNIVATILVLVAVARSATALAALPITTRPTVADTPRAGHAGMVMALTLDRMAVTARAGMAGTVVVPADEATGTLHEATPTVVTTPGMPRMDLLVTAGQVIMARQAAAEVTLDTGKGGEDTRAIIP